MPAERASLVDVLAPLSLTTDLATGFPFERGLRACLVAVTFDPGDGTVAGAQLAALEAVPRLLRGSRLTPRGDPSCPPAQATCCTVLRLVGPRRDWTPVCSACPGPTAVTTLNTELASSGGAM